MEETQEAQSERGSRASSRDGEDTHVDASTAGASGEQWTEEEWQAWRAWRGWYPPPAPTPSGSYASNQASKAIIEWDPWAAASSTRRASHDDDRIGGSDKISVPEFTGEEDKDGLVTRGYLRKVAAWKRMTRLKPTKQALALYNNLSGRAWRDAEEIDLALLDDESGVDYFTKWIADKYLDKEVVKVGKCMLEFFRVLKKQTSQDIREFNQEYDRQVSRLKEIGCNLPDICLAWLYLDKLRLDNNSELNLLSSTGNRYNLEKLQEAAIIQDRMNRRLWELEDKFIVMPTVTAAPRTMSMSLRRRRARSLTMTRFLKARMNCSRKKTRKSTRSMWPTRTQSRSTRPC